MADIGILGPSGECGSQWESVCVTVKWCPAPGGPEWSWRLLGLVWLTLLVGGWGCWRYWRGASAGKRGLRRGAVVAWVLVVLLGLNWYAAGRVAPWKPFEEGNWWVQRYLLVSRPGSVRHVDLWGDTPLHGAASAGHAEAIQFMLAGGADVNAKDRFGETPLNLAGGCPEAIQLLLAAGADVNAKTNCDRTPLHSAAVGGRPEAIQLLLAAGADVNAREYDGETPLHSAAAGGGPDAIQLLLAAGARVNERDDKGQTALDIAGSDETRAALRQAGAKTGKELDVEKAKPAPAPATVGPGGK